MPEFEQTAGFPDQTILSAVKQLNKDTITGKLRNDT